MLTHEAIRKWLSIALMKSGPVTSLRYTVHEWFANRNSRRRRYRRVLRRSGGRTARHGYRWSNWRRHRPDENLRPEDRRRTTVDRYRWRAYPVGARYIASRRNHCAG